MKHEYQLGQVVDDGDGGRGRRAAEGLGGQGLKEKGENEKGDDVYDYEMEGLLADRTAPGASEDGDKRVTWADSDHSKLLEEVIPGSLAHFST